MKSMRDLVINELNKGLSQRLLADKMGVSLGTVQNILFSNTTKFKLETLKKVSNYFRVPVSQFYPDSESEPFPEYKAQSDNLHPRPDIASVIHAVTDIMYSGQGEIIDALVKNVQEFKRATETVKRLNACEIELKDLKDEVSGLKKQIDRLTAPPTGADLKAS